MGLLSQIAVIFVGFRQHGRHAVAGHGAAADGVHLVGVGFVGVLLEADGLDVHLLADEASGELVGGYLASEAGRLALVVEDGTQHRTVTIKRQVAPDGSPKSGAAHGDDDSSIIAIEL